MVPQPEQQARENIDALLQVAGWHVCDADKDNIHAAGIIEAKKEGATLTGVETQSGKCTKSLPAGLPRSTSPMTSLHC